MAKVMIIDDSQDLLEIFSLILKMKGFEAKTISSQDTIQISLAEFMPDVILLDVVLDGADGRQVCKEIKNNAKKIPIILISANPNLLQNYEEWKADAVIEKPFDIKTVINQVSIVLNRYQPAPLN